MFHPQATSTLQPRRARSRRRTEGMRTSLCRRRSCTSTPSNPRLSRSWRTARPRMSILRGNVACRQAGRPSTSSTRRHGPRTLPSYPRRQPGGQRRRTCTAMSLAGTRRTMGTGIRGTTREGATAPEQGTPSDHAVNSLSFSPLLSISRPGLCLLSTWTLPPLDLDSASSHSAAYCLFASSSFCISSLSPYFRHPSGPFPPSSHFLLPLSLPFPIRFHFFGLHVSLFGSSPGHLVLFSLLSLSLPCFRVYTRPVGSLKNSCVLRL